jgi:hypothetical protein
LNGKVDKVCIDEDLVGRAKLCVVFEEESRRSFGSGHIESPGERERGQPNKGKKKRVSNYTTRSYERLIYLANLLLHISLFSLFLVLLPESNDGGQVAFTETLFFAVRDAPEKINTKKITNNRLSFGLIIRFTAANFLVFLVLPYAIKEIPEYSVLCSWSTPTAPMEARLKTRNRRHTMVAYIF